MAQTWYKTDTAADNSGTKCDATALATNPFYVECALSDPSPSGSDTITMPAKQTYTVGAFESPGGIGVSSIPAGDWTINFNVTSAAASGAQWREIHICEIQPGGTNVKTIGSNTGLAVDVATTGNKQGTVTLGSPVSVTSTNHWYIQIVIYCNTHAGSSVTIDRSLTIVDTIVGATTHDLAGTVAATSTVTGNATVTQAQWALAGAIGATSTIVGDLDHLVMWKLSASGASVDLFNGDLETETSAFTTQFDGKVTDGSNTLTITTTAAEKYRGSQGAKCTFDGTEEDTYAHESFADQDELYGRFYFKLNADYEHTGTYKYLTIFTLKDSTTHCCRMAIQNTTDGTTFRWNFVYREGAGYTTVYQGGTVAVDTWYRLECHWKAGTGADGGAEFKVNGASVGSDWSGTSSTLRADQVFSGAIQNSSTADPLVASEIYWDDVALDTTGWIGDEAIGSGGIEAQATVTGNLTLVPLVLAGAIAATSTVAGDLTVMQAQWNLAGTVEAQSVLTGDLTVLAGGTTHVLAGSIAATSTVTGDATVTHATWALAGAIGATSALTGDLDLLEMHQLAGAVGVTSEILGGLGVPYNYGITLLPSSSWPSSVVTADQDDYGANWEVGAFIYSMESLAGTVAAQSVITGNITVSGVHALAGAVGVTSTFVGDLTVTQAEWALAGSIGATSTFTGDLTVAGTHNLAGVIGAASAFTGTLNQTYAVVGSIGVTSTFVGDATVTREIAGTIGATSIFTGNLAVTGTHDLAGAIGAVSTFTGGLTVAGTFDPTLGTLTIAGHNPSISSPSSLYYDFEDDTIGQMADGWSHLYGAGTAAWDVQNVSGDKRFVTNGSGEGTSAVVCDDADVLTDVMISGNFRLYGGTGPLGIFLRHTGDAEDDGLFVIFDQSGDQIVLYSFIDGALDATLDTAAVTIDAATLYEFRVEAVGTTFRAKCWSGAEPAWQASGTNSDHTSGYVVLHNNAANMEVDDVIISSAGIDQSVEVTPNAGTMTIAGNDPTVISTVGVSPTLGTLVIAGYDPIVAAGVSAGLGTIEITGLDPVVLAGIGVSAGLGTIEVTGYDPVINSSLYPGVGTITIAGYDPTVFSASPITELFFKFKDTDGTVRTRTILRRPVVVVTTTTYTIGSVSTEEIVLADASGGAFTATLPTAAGKSGYVHVIKKTDSSANAVKVDGNGAETIDGAADFDLESQDEVIRVVSDNVNWWIV